MMIMIDTNINDIEFKKSARKQAIAILTLAIPCWDCKDPTYLSMMDMVHAVLVLTNDIEI